MSKNNNSAGVPNCFKVAGNSYFPFSNDNMVERLPSGIYELEQPFGQPPYLEKLKLNTDRIVDMQGSVTEMVLKEVDQFWSAGVSQKFKDYGLVHKRGILLHGAPGCGKTVTLSQVAKYVEEVGGVVLFNPDVNLLLQFVKLVRRINGDDCKICVMWEEFDSMLQSQESSLLSLLDGELQISNVLYIATTNYISRIPARIKNRPSRFASIIEVGVPSRDARQDFFSKKLIGNDLKYVENFTEITEGFVVDQMKDLIISVCCFGTEPAEAVKKIVEMDSKGVGVDDYTEEEHNKFFLKESAKTNKSKYNLMKAMQQVVEYEQQTKAIDLFSNAYNSNENRDNNSNGDDNNENL